MTIPQVIASIKSKSYSPVYFLHGEETFFIDKIIKLIETSILDESEKAFNQIVLYGKEADFKQVVDNARQFPMMSEKRVVIVKEAQEMRSLKELESYMLNPSPQTILALAYKHKRLDKRTKFAKALAKKATIIESKKLYDNQLPDWIRTRVSELGYKIDPDANRLMAEYLGSDLGKVNNELEKIILNLNKGESIGTSLIEDQIGISKDFNVFELQKAIGQKDAQKVARIFQYFAANQKANPIPLILGSLYSYLTKLMITKSNPSLSDDQLRFEIGLASSYFAKDYKIAAKNYSMNGIKFLMQKLRLADLQSKGIGYRNMGSANIYKEMAAIFVNL